MPKSKKAAEDSPAEATTLSHSEDTASEAAGGDASGSSSALAIVLDAKAHAKAIATSDIQDARRNRIAEITLRYRELSSQVTPAAVALKDHIAKLRLLFPAEGARIEAEVQKTQSEVQRAERALAAAQDAIAALQADLAAAQRDADAQKAALAQARQAASAAQKALAEREKAKKAFLSVETEEPDAVTTALEEAIAEREAQWKNEMELQLLKLEEEKATEIATAEKEAEAALKALENP